MKLKDLHKNLNPEINLLKFRPKKGILVDSFGIKENIIIDISENKIKKTIKLKQGYGIKLKNISKKNNFDSLKITKNNRDINLSEKKNNKLLKKITIEKVNNIFFQRRFNYFKRFKSFKIIKSLYKIPNFILYFFIFIIIIYIDKLAVIHFTKSGYEKLNSLKNNTSQTSNISLIKSSNSDFKISNILFLPFKILSGKKINDASNSILGGIQTTDLLLNISNFIEKINNFIENKGEENVAYSQLLENSKDIFLYSEKEINNILKTYNKIDFSDNILLKNELDYFKLKLKEFEFYTNSINSNFDTFLNILGHNKRKKYLIIFQNNDEIRPQGGFMGSMGILEIFRGQFKKFEKKDVYDYEFKIKKEYFKRENAPEGLNKITPNLGLRDSNYYINNKDSSEKIKFFIEKSGYKIDGIIYVNQNSLFKMLDLLGEFESKVLKTKVNSSNFSTIMSSLVESKKYHVGTLGTPKQVLFDFMKEFKEIIEKRGISKLDLAKIIFKDIKNREIIFYNFNTEERKLLEELNIYNPIKYNDSLDFSYPVFTSISGNKSDRYIKTNYIKTVKNGDKCSFYTILNINLEHTFNKIELEKNKKIFNTFGIKKDFNKLLSIQGNGINKQYIRVILPKNAVIVKSPKIISIKNYYKNGKIIDFYLNTKVGKKSNFKVEYTIPNNECKIYNFKLYKQPGIRQYNLDINIFGESKIFRNIKEDLFIN